MTRLVESLLMLARFDEEDEADLALVELSRLVRDCCLGDEAQLRSLLGKLLGNVRMPTPADVLCHVSLGTTSVAADRRQHRVTALAAP